MNQSFKPIKSGLASEEALAPMSATEVLVAIEPAMGRSVCAVP